MDEYRVDKMEVDKVKEGEELTKVSLCKIFFANFVDKKYINFNLLYLL